MNEGLVVKAHVKGIDTLLAFCSLVYLTIHFCIGLTTLLLFAFCIHWLLTDVMACFVVLYVSFIAPPHRMVGYKTMIQSLESSSPHDGLPSFEASPPRGCRGGYRLDLGYSSNAMQFMLSSIGSNAMP